MLVCCNHLMRMKRKLRLALMHTKRLREKTFSRLHSKQCQGEWAKVQREINYSLPSMHCNERLASSPTDIDGTTTDSRGEKCFRIRFRAFLPPSLSFLCGSCFIFQRHEGKKIFTCLVVIFLVWCCVKLNSKAACFVCVLLIHPKGKFLHVASSFVFLRGSSRNSPFMSLLVTLLCFATC